jgi:glucans biosynthesis protein C
MPRAVTMSRSSLALDNLRAVVILIVLAFHSVLAYVQWIPQRTAGFNDPPYQWRSFPILDSHRWFGFDLFCAWQDVYLMSLMFLLSGLFVWPSLARKRNWRFVRDRLLRLGVPFAFGIIVLIPVAIYPVYLVSATNPSVPDYIDHYLALPFVHNGQLWFLWQLLALNFVAVGINWVAPNALPALGRWAAVAGKRPGYFFALLVAVTAFAYVPLALIFTPWEWVEMGFLPLQLSRPLLYAVYFFTGLAIGVEGIDCGLVEADGPLARRWALWLAAALVSLALWMAATSLTFDDPVPVGIRIAADLSFVLACASGCFFFLAASLRFGARRSTMMSNLSANAYSLYLLHYVFDVWLQYALLPFALFAVVKGAIVFIVTVALSWITTLVVQRTTIGARLIGSTLPSAAVTQSPSSSPAGLYARLRQFVSQ